MLKTMRTSTQPRVSRLLGPDSSLSSRCSPAPPPHPRPARPQGDLSRAAATPPAFSQSLAPPGGRQERRFYSSGSRPPPAGTASWFWFLVLAKANWKTKRLVPAFDHQDPCGGGGVGGSPPPARQNPGAVRSSSVCPGWVASAHKSLRPTLGLHKGETRTGIVAVHAAARDYIPKGWDNARTAISTCSNVELSQSLFLTTAVILLLFPNLSFS